MRTVVVLKKKPRYTAIYSRLPITWIPSESKRERENGGGGKEEAKRVAAVRGGWPTWKWYWLYHETRNNSREMMQETGEDVW
jgi:hypothetical protein